VAPTPQLNNQLQDPWPVTDAKPSKSSRKRQFSELQQLGELLIGLTDAQLLGTVSEPRLIDAVREARSIRSHGALRRQKQLIGKIMRDIDPIPIRTAIDALGRQTRDDKRLFKEAESWRDRLCTDGIAALPDLLALTGIDNPALRRLVREYSAATRDVVRKTARRQIFREIHKDLRSMVQNGTC
jgi:ribosome-associated protein